MKQIKRFFLSKFIFYFISLLFLLFLLTPPVFASGLWTQLGLADRQVGSMVNDSTNPNIFYAGTDNGIYKSNDGGSSWIIESNQGISSSIVDISF